MGSKSHKEKKSKRDSKDKSRKDRKHKKEKHKKEKSKHRRRSSSPSDSRSSSGSDGERLGTHKQLQMGRTAVRAIREILAYNADLRKELRELVRQLDSGGALEVSGIPDAFLRSRLLVLLDNLVQLNKNSAGQYFKRRHADSTVLSFVAPILEETADMLAPYKKASEQFAAAAAAAEEAARAAAAAAEAEAQQQEAAAVAAGQRGTSPEAGARIIGPAAGSPHRQQEQREQQEGLLESEGDEDEEGGEGGLQAAAGVIGPAAFPPGVQVAGQEDNEEEEGVGEESGDEEDAAAAGRRAAGPAMPPAEWLAAAAQMEYPVSDEEAGGGGGDEDEEDEDEGLLVGPPPLEFAEELDAAPMDDRTAEVVRVLRVLAQHEADHAKSTAAEAAEKPPDAYEVLGVEPDTPAGEVKKRYWRLSLLIHPDKCDHPRAHDAFQAVTGAAKELQDAALRKKVDERRQEAELRREFAAAAAQEERERQWRIARGQATAADLAGPVVPAGPAVRETWMTELPPEKGASNPLAMPTGPVQAFSQRGKQGRGDTSGWTMTPQQRAAQLEGGSAAAAGPMLLTSGGVGGADGGVAAANPAQASRMAAAVDAFNSQTRKKTLMELHAERMAAGAGGDKKEKKARKKQKTEGGGGSSKGGAAGAAADLGYDPTQHPWRPFDREKDLGPGLNAKAKAEDLLKGTRALASKFGGGQGGGRTFL